MTTANATEANYPKGVAMVLFAGCLWSIGGLVVRYIENANEWQILYYRSIALACTLFCYLLLRHKSKIIQIYKGSGSQGIIAGICLGTAFASWIFAMTHTTIANALFILASAPFITAVIAKITLGEKVTRTTILCMSVAAMGIAIMVVEGILSGALLGNLYALGAAIGFSIFTVLLRKSKNVEMTPAVFWAGIWGIIISASMILVTKTGFSITPHDLSMCATLGVVQVGLGLIIYALGAKYVPAAELALLSLTEVILGPILVWLGVGEVPSFYTITGGAIVLCALVYQAQSGIRDRRLVMSTPH